MTTLLLTLAGPMQSWGSRSRFTTRGTELAPTKSGVIGLLAAALGMERTASLDKFSGLRFGVRIDQPGRIERDFQTARTLDGSTSMPLSTRHYLADAVFLAGLEAGDRAFLDELAAAVAHPVFPLSLGRRAFPPAGPIRVSVVAEDLETALRAAEWRASEWYRDTLKDQAVSLEYSMEALPGEQVSGTLRDAPVSFDPRRREYGWREVREGRIDLPGPTAQAGDGDSPAVEPPPTVPRRHEPFDALPEGQ